MTISPPAFRPSAGLGLPRAVALHLLEATLLDGRAPVAGEDHPDRLLLAVSLEPEPVSVRYWNGVLARTIALSPDEFLSIPGGSGDVVSWERPARTLLIAIDPDVFHAFVEAEIGVAAPSCALVRRLHFRNPEVRELAARLAHEIPSAQIGGPIVLDALARALLVVLVRHYADRTPRRPDPGALTPERLRAVTEFARANLGRPIRRDELARAVGMSGSAFARALRAALGQTPHAFLAELRIGRAKELMADPGRQLGTIAFETGFADQAHFSRSFRKATGLAPSAWRKAPRAPETSGMFKNEGGYFKRGALGPPISNLVGQEPARPGCP